MGKAKTPRRAILLLHGEERFLVDERARATLDDWLKELVSDFGHDTLEGQGLTPPRLQDAILQAPFLDPYRVVYARMAAASRSESLATALKEIPPTTRLLITIAGRLSAAEIIRTVPHGLYVTELIGMGVNPVTGDYSRGAVGLWIDNGELAFPVEEITIAGNLLEMFHAIEGVGNDLLFRDRTTSPSLLVGRMTVAGHT